MKILVTVDAIVETNLKIKRLLGVYSAFGRDPRGHVISICYVAKAQGKERGGSDAEDN